MKLTTVYYEGDIAIILFNDSLTTYDGPIKISVNGYPVKCISRIVIPFGSKLISNVNFQLDSYENVIKVECNNGILADRILIPEYYLTCKLFNHIQSL